MKLPLALTLLVCASASATPVVVDLGAPGQRAGETVVQFSDFTGTPLEGQQITFDLVFTSNGQPASILPARANSIDLLVVLPLSAALPIELPAIPGDSFILDTKGERSAAIITGPEVRVVGAVPPTREAIAVIALHVDDVRSIHVDFTAPNLDPDFAGVDITGGYVLLTAFDRPYSVHVPDSGATVALFALALVCLIVGQSSSALRPRGWRGKRTSP